MTGTSVATVGMNRGVTYVDPKRQNTSNAKRYLAKTAMPGKSPFLGTQINFNGKDGFFAIGFGDTAKKKHDMTLVLNVPQTLVTWRYWPEESAPSYPFITTLLGDEALPDRDGAGHVGETKEGYNGDDEDVMNEGTILILRDPKTNEMYNFHAFKTGQGAANEFIMSLLDEPDYNEGLLPIVKLTVEEVSYKNKKGKRVDFKKPAFSVVDWVEPTKYDAPVALGKAQAKQEADDEADAKAKRDLEAPPRGKPTLSERDRKDLNRARREAEDAEEVDEAPKARNRRPRDEDQDEAVDHSKGNSKSRDPRNNPPAFEDEDEPKRDRNVRGRKDEDDEDDRPTVRSRAQRRGDDDNENMGKAPARGRRNDDDEDDDADSRAAVRRRRAS